MASRASLQDKIVWITGASSGIGEAVALECGRRGARVALTARRKDRLEEIAAQITESGGHSLAAEADVTSREGIREALGAIQRTWGDVDLLITSAGTYVPTDPTKFDAAEYGRMMDLNYTGTLRCVEAVLPAMLARRAGHLGIISSVVGYRGLPRAAAYGATKAALINFFESARFHLEPEGIRVSIINPGFVKTPLTDKNEFEMPFLIPADKAARLICDGLEKQKKEVHFPAPFSWSLKFLRILPYPLYHSLIRKKTMQ